MKRRISRVSGLSDAATSCRTRPNLMRVVIHRWLFLFATLTLAGAGGLLGASAASDEHGLPPQAVDIARPLGLPITNSMVVTWIVALGLIIFAWVATRDMKAVPDGAQNFLEWLVGGLYSFLEGII